MEEVLGFFGFSLGASIGVSAVRSLSDGVQPLLRNVLKVGIRFWDAAASTAASARQEATDASPADAEARAEAARRQRRNRAKPQKIEIARS